MSKMECAKKLRAELGVHYNCCQSVLVPYAKELGMTEQDAYQLGAHFGSGMRFGSTCGAVTGGLMVLGAMGCDETVSELFLSRFKEKYAALDCAAMLKLAEERGEEKKNHCDGAVFVSLELLGELTGEHV